MSIQADTSLVQVASMKEATWAVIPGSVALKSKRVTGETLEYDKSTVQSEEIRSDRQSADLTESAVDAKGDIDTELSFGAHDDWIGPGWLSGTDTDWSTPFDYSGAHTSGDVQITASTKTIAASGATFTPLRVGQFIRLTGCTNAANDGTYTLVTVNTHSLVVAEALSGGDENSSAAQIRGSMMRSGSVISSFLIEKAFPDITQYIAFPGMEVDQAAFTFEAGKEVTVKYSWMGQKAVGSASTLDSDSTYDAPTSADVLNATADVGSIMLNGSVLSTPIQKIEMTGKNNLRTRQAIGSKYTVGVGTGTFQLSGTLTVYLEDLVLFNHMVDHDALALQFRVFDAAGNTYIFTMNKIRLAKGSPTAPKINQDVILPLDFTAVYDPTTGAMIQIDKLAA